MTTGRLNLDTNALLSTTSALIQLRTRRARSSALVRANLLRKSCTETAGSINSIVDRR